ncbi:MAG TPA: phosphate acyltransferase PlsX [Candidatus Limnocylindria bacterium]|nr:phosphate acyltransferase PlsX [Candidatus Limnocylindria bacterium]
MRIAVDVMGGDHGCGVVVSGVKIALERSGHECIGKLFLVGTEAEVKAALQQQCCVDPRIEIVNATQVLTMEDNPLTAIRRKKDASVVRAVALVRDGKADAVISLGNTGGLVAAATFGLGRLDLVKRPAIVTIMPTVKGHFVLLDAGANPECEPLHLFQFAVIGSVCAREILGIQKPRVGILSNGSEDFKGTDLTQQAAEMCRQSELNFIGYVEGTEIFADRVDVVVTDGFVGNIVLKTAEGLGKTILHILKSELTATPLRKFGALLAKSGFRKLKTQMDPEAHGGARIVGLKGTVVKVHGSASERVVANALRQIAESASQHLNERIGEAIARAQPRLAVTA